MKVGYRTLKTAFGTALAIFIAQTLNLDFYISAGIITILCIKATKKESLKSSFIRFIASIIGLALSGLLFFLFGYTPIVIALILIFFIPILVAFKIQDGFVTSSVVLLHLYTSQTISVNMFMNELQLIIVGIGVAFLMNMYMPNMEKKIIEYRDLIERNFISILKELVYYLRYEESNWKGKEIVETAELLHRAKSLAFQNVENHLLRKEDSYYFYFEMREKQFEILERIIPIVSSLSEQVEQREKIAIFLDKLSNNVHPGDTTHIFIAELDDLKEDFKNEPLPQSREEFETRAALFQIINEIERYLFIKKNFNKDKIKKSLIAE